MTFRKKFYILLNSVILENVSQICRLAFSIELKEDLWNQNVNHYTIYTKKWRQNFQFRVHARFFSIYDSKELWNGKYGKLYLLPSVITEALGIFINFLMDAISYLTTTILYLNRMDFSKKSGTYCSNFLDTPKNLSNFFGSKKHLD